MKIEILDYFDNWQAVKDAAMNTIGKETGKAPTSDWKWKILKAEHSPIRLLEFTIRITDIPFWISVHLTRHNVGVTHFVSTQRTDRTGIDRSKLPQDALVSHTMRINAQALINISRKRLCAQAAPETRRVWEAVVTAIRKIEPELGAVCVPECIYRGHCPEMHSCGYCDTGKYKLLSISYRKGISIAPTIEK